MNLKEMGMKNRKIKFMKGSGKAHGYGFRFADVLGYGRGNIFGYGYSFGYGCKCGSGDGCGDVFGHGRAKD